MLTCCLLISVEFHILQLSLLQNHSFFPNQDFSFNLSHPSFFPSLPLLYFYECLRCFYYRTTPRSLTRLSLDIYVYETQMADFQIWIQWVLTVLSILITLTVVSIFVPFLILIRKPGFTSKFTSTTDVVASQAIYILFSVLYVTRTSIRPDTLIDTTSTLSIGLMGILFVIDIYWALRVVYIEGLLDNGKEANIILRNLCYWFLLGGNLWMDGFDGCANVVVWAMTLLTIRSHIALKTLYWIQDSNVLKPMLSDKKLKEIQKDSPKDPVLEFEMDILMAFKHNALPQGHQHSLCMEEHVNWIGLSAKEKYCRLRSECTLKQKLLKSKSWILCSNLGF